MTKQATTLFFLILLAIGLSLHRDTVEAAPTVTNIVNEDVEDFVIHNGKIYYTVCYGDAGQYGVQFKQKPIVGGAATTLATVNSTHFCDARDLQTDGIALYYVKPSDQIIERRLIGSPTVVQTVQQYFSYNEPTDLAYFDGYLYWSAENNRIYRDTPTGDGEIIFANTADQPTAIDVDERYVWWGSSSGLYKATLTCTTPCSDATPDYADPIGRIHAASKNGRTAVFWIGDYANATLESYDCNIPDTAGCFHKDLYTAPANNFLFDLAASDDYLFWIEVIDNSEVRLRRVERNGGFADNIVTNVGLGSDFLHYTARNLLDTTGAFAYFQHNGVSREVFDATPIFWHITPIRMMVTQGSQNSFNDVPLVADKPTYVHVQARKTQGPDLTGLVAELAGTVNGVALPGSPLRPIRYPNGVSGFNPPAFGTWDNAWLFELPPTWTAAGTVDLTVTVDPRNSYNTSLQTRSDSVTFQTRPPICVVALRVRTHAPKPSTNMTGYGFAVAQAERMLPTHAIWRYKKGGLLEEGLWPFYSPYELPDDRTKILQNIWWHDQFSDDPDECDDANARTLYMGIVHPDTRSGSLGGVAYRDKDQLWVKLPFDDELWGVMAAGWPLWGREPIVAHEIGHNLGRKHTDCGDPDDPGFYPYPLDQLEDSTIDGGTHFGYESLQSKIIAPTDGADVMSYCGPQWTSDYTWRAIFSELASSRAAALREAASEAVRNANDVVLVTGIVDTEGMTGTLDTAWSMPTGSVSRSMVDDWSAIAGIESAERAATLQIRFNVAFGSPVVYSVTPQEIDDDDSLIQWFGAAFPRPSGLVTGISLLVNGVVVDTRSAGVVVPQMTLELPAGGEVATTQLTARWTASDSDALHFSLQYSPDNGATWRVVGHNLQSRTDGGDEYEVVLDSANWEGSNGQNGLLRILASDGLNTTIVTSNPFTVPNRAPDMYIDAPMEGQRFAAGSVVSVEGLATDPESGPVAAANISWTLNGVSQGSGEQLTLDGLAPGEYTLVGTATDGSAQGSQTRTFTIAPLQMGTGSADLDGRCLDDAYSESDQIGLRPYSDGTQAIATFSETDDYWYICFSGLRDGMFNEYVGVRVDGNSSGDFYAQTSDYRFEVYPDGELRVRAGNGSGGFGETVSVYVENTFAAEVTAGNGGATWNTELRIERRNIQVTADTAALTVAHSWVDSQGNDYYWPHNAGWRNPYTWATTNFKRTPQVVSVTPNVIDLPSGDVWLTIGGGDFKAGDEVLWDGEPLGTLVLTNSLLGNLPASEMTMGDHVVTVRSADNIISDPLIVRITSPTPTLDSVSPAQVTQSSGAHTLTLTGSDFVNGATVLLDGTPLATTFINSTQLRATLPASETAFIRDAQLVVQNPEPVQVMSDGVNFVVQGVPTQVGLVGGSAEQPSHTAWLWLALLLLLCGTWVLVTRNRSANDARRSLGSVLGARNGGVH